MKNKKQMIEKITRLASMAESIANEISVNCKTSDEIHEIYGRIAYAEVLIKDSIHYLK